MNTYRRRVLGFILSSLMISSIQAAGRGASGPVLVASFRRTTPPALALALTEGPHLALARSPSFEALTTERKRKERSASQEFVDRWHPQLESIVNGFFALTAETDKSKIMQKSAQLTTRAALLKKSLKEAHDKIADDLYASLVLELRDMIPDPRWSERVEEAEELLKHAEEVEIDRAGYGPVIFRDAEWRAAEQKKLTEFQIRIAACSSQGELLFLEEAIDQTYFYTHVKPVGERAGGAAGSEVVVAALLWTWNPNYLVLGQFGLEIGDLYVALEAKRNEFLYARGGGLLSPGRHFGLTGTGAE